MASPAISSIQTVPVAHRRILWVTRSRMAYCGALTNMAARTFGAWSFYIALDRPFRIALAGHAARRERIALVPPHVQHVITPSDREIAQIVIEEETVAPEADLQALVATPERREATRARLLQGFSEMLASPESFDVQFFGHDLPTRTLDPRIVDAIERMDVNAGINVTAEECALAVGLSFSRFTHLFSAQTGTTFRRFRAWKRARSLMLKVGGSPSLVDVALEAGYADSAHFSHSIRQFYGCTPRDLFARSRSLSIVSQWPTAAAS